MKTRRTQRRPFWAALVLVASLFLALLITAPGVEANSGAGGKILNTVTVSYKDAANTTFTANATTTVTIQLVKAGLTISGRPTSGAKGKLAAMPGPQTVNSGVTASYIIALTSNANGGDNYNLSAALSNPVNVSGQTIGWRTLQSDGSTVMGAANPATVSLGASVIQANDATSISIPGNSNLAALITDNPTAHKTLIVNGVDYIVSSIVTGVDPLNTHGGNTYYNNLGTATAETLTKINLAINPAGGNLAPAFTVNALIGQQVGEQVLVRVDVTASVATPGTNGTVDFIVTTSDSSSGHVVATTAITTTFTAANVQVQKGVRNCGQATTVGVCGAGAYLATAPANPGDIMEYRVMVNNAASFAANLVTATDAVPVYTTLISFVGVYGDGGTLGTGIGTNNFATVNDGTTTVAMTIQSSDTENGSVASGDTGGITAGSAIHFFIGTGNTNITGGTVASGATYTILYRVKVN